MKQVLKSFSILSLVIILSTSVIFAASKDNSAKGIESNKFYAKESKVINGVQVNNFFSKDGNFIGSSNAFSFNQLDATVKETISKKYLTSGYSISESIAFTNEEEETTYYLKLVSANNSIILQISNGKYISILKV